MLFYGWWDWRFLLLIIVSGTLDYFAALLMVRRPQHKRLLLYVSLLGNLGSLTIFKYSSFLAGSLDGLFSSLGLQTNLLGSIPPFALILPVGISFYTFQSMSYTIDVYRGELEPTRHFLHFFAYLSMFPQLVAGPIVRASELLPQLLTANDTSEEQRWQGTQLIAKGFFKKVVIADNLAASVNIAFAQTMIEVQSSSGVGWWLVVTAFAFQIYCDFSGYSGIARGLAKWMGYEFPVNFNHPYIATSMRDFWSRWHISLSTWFRDYVYVPLGGSRQGKARAHVYLWLTMIVSGLWHGAAWTFVIWGALHALFMSLERLTKWPQRLNSLLGKQIGSAIATILVLLQVWIGWVFFRADSAEKSLLILKQMFTLGGGFSVSLRPVALLVLTLIILHELATRLEIWEQRLLQPILQGPVVAPLLVAVALAAAIYWRGPGSEFIYFQF